jgi:hypothetical protein
VIIPQEAGLISADVGLEEKGNLELGVSLSPERMRKSNYELIFPLGIG